MKFASVSLLLTAALTQVRASPTLRPKWVKPPYFITVGDSTVAIDGGWGDGFLSYLQDGADGINTGKSGATTASYRWEGLWDKAIAAVEANKEAFSPIVTIQFGHNDQKPQNGVSEPAFQQNLQTMAEEVQRAGGTPIIITSLTRRTFSGGAVVENLAAHTALAIRAAEAVGIDYLDLNRASTDYINSIGNANGGFYDWGPGDKTHLNPAGTVVFGRMVVDLLLRERPDLEPYFRPQKALSDKIWSGEFATGDE
ncbi:acetylesterase [Stachybotrys elegans]|uniref:Acetylesterase n=1 Tax=Stachybotrys elegans TaxID=80388 RepID=A0A8K0SW19_9HYPO|nr:acetylesterase [Stachybotrys elegans]